MLALYPAADDAAANAAVEALARDRGLASTYLWAREREKVTKRAIYLYLWTHTEPGPEASATRPFTRRRFRTSLRRSAPLRVRLPMRITTSPRS